MIFRYNRGGKATPSYITQVQSHSRANVVIEIVDMRSNTLLALFIFCFLLTTFTYVYGLQVFYDVAARDPSNSVIENIRDSWRNKRDIESFDNDDYPSAAAQDEQEEPGFWDRIVRVALKLFNRFIEWLNSS